MIYSVSSLISSRIFPKILELDPVVFRMKSCRTPWELSTASAVLNWRWSRQNPLKRLNNSKCISLGQLPFIFSSVFVHPSYLDSFTNESVCWTVLQQKEFFYYEWHGGGVGRTGKSILETVVFFWEFHCESGQGRSLLFTSSQTFISMSPTFRIIPPNSDKVAQRRAEKRKCGAYTIVIRHKKALLIDDSQFFCIESLQE